MASDIQEKSSEFYPTNLHFLSALDLGRDPLVRGKQVVEIKHTLKEPRSLADPVWTTGHTRELHMRDVCWKQANGELSYELSSVMLNHI